jgi:hypothetical protein
VKYGNPETRLNGGKLVVVGDDSGAVRGQLGDVETRLSLLEARKIRMAAAQLTSNAGPIPGSSSIPIPLDEWVPYGGTQDPDFFDHSSAYGITVLKAGMYRINASISSGGVTDGGYRTIFQVVVADPANGDNLNGILWARGNWYNSRTEPFTANHQFLATPPLYLAAGTTIGMRLYVQGSSNVEVVAAGPATWLSIETVNDPTIADVAGSGAIEARLAQVEQALAATPIIEHGVVTMNLGGASAAGQDVSFNTTFPNSPSVVATATDAGSSVNQNLYNVAAVQVDTDGFRATAKEINGNTSSGDIAVRWVAVGDR